MERLAENEQDLVDTLTYLRTQPQWNGRAFVMGFCYGGPFAIVGSKRLGYQAGVACHGSQMLGFIGELAGATQPMCLIWGDHDHIAPTPMLEAFTEAARGMANLEVDFFLVLSTGL